MLYFAFVQGRQILNKNKAKYFHIRMNLFIIFLVIENCFFYFCGASLKGKHFYWPDGPVAYVAVGAC
jgi:hypothetical protein